MHLLNPCALLAVAPTPPLTHALTEPKGPFWRLFHHTPDLLAHAAAEPCEHKVAPPGVASLEPLPSIGCVALAARQYAAQRWVSVASCVADCGHVICGVVVGCGWAAKFMGGTSSGLPSARGSSGGRRHEAVDARYADGGVPW